MTLFTHSTRRFTGLAVSAAAATLALPMFSSTSASAAPRVAAAGPGSAVSAAAPRFSHPTRITNPYFALRPGVQFSYRGSIVEGGTRTPHTVTFTVTDLTAVIHGVRTVVAWDRDFVEGRLREQELAFFAQDDAGNVWNFGEYPEEYENGKLTGAPSTWVRGTGDAYGGIHVLRHPRVGMSYLEGKVDSIGFWDVSRVVSTDGATCVPTGCYDDITIVYEGSPDDPTSGTQVKYYAPGRGLVRVAARGGDAREFLALSGFRHLSASALASIRRSVLAMDARGRRITTVYRTVGRLTR